MWTTSLNETLKRNSSLMILRSRTGSTFPSTCVTSPSEKARVTWNKASVACTHITNFTGHTRTWRISVKSCFTEILARNSLPKPLPSCAPFTSPAISVTVSTAGILRHRYHACDDRWSHYEITRKWQAQLQHTVFWVTKFSRVVRNACPESKEDNCWWYVAGMAIVFTNRHWHSGDSGFQSAEREIFGWDVHLNDKEMHPCQIMETANIIIWIQC